MLKQTKAEIHKELVERNLENIEQRKTIEALTDTIGRQSRLISSRNADVETLRKRVDLLEDDRWALTSAVRVIVREDDVRTGRSKIVEMPASDPGYHPGASKPA